VKNTGCLTAPAALSLRACSECCLDRGEHCAGVTDGSHQLTARVTQHTGLAWVWIRVTAE